MLKTRNTIWDATYRERKAWNSQIIKDFDLESYAFRMTITF